MINDGLKQEIAGHTREIEAIQKERLAIIRLLYPQDSNVTVKVHNGTWPGTVKHWCTVSLYIHVKHDRTGKVHRIYYKDIIEQEVADV